MNLYEQFGVGPEASQQDIKRAYFSLVRQFSPEKEPDKFIKLRQAYETLSSEEKRAAYDASLSRFTDKPDEVASLIMEVERLASKQLFADAVRLLEHSKYSSHLDVQLALCDIYMDMDKTGKATKIIEKLIAKNPDNADYLRMAIDIYMARGWSNKAWVTGDYLERLDPADEDNRHVLVFDETFKAPLLLGEEVESIERNGGKAPLLCAHILKNCLMSNRLGWYKTSYYNRQMSLDQLDENKVATWDDPLTAAAKLAEHTASIPQKKRGQIRELLEDHILIMLFNEDCYNVLPHIDQTIKNIGAEELFASQGYCIISLGYTALEAVRAGIPKKLAALPLMNAWSRSDIGDKEYLAGCRNKAIILEIDILDDYKAYIPQIMRLKDEFNAFYQHAADFFNMVLQSGAQKIESEFFRRIPKMKGMESELSLSWLGDDEDEYSDGNSDPETRQEPVSVDKTGRNDPCPCGSGKKYKKCCGA